MTKAKKSTSKTDLGSRRKSSQALAKVTSEAVYVPASRLMKTLRDEHRYIARVMELYADQLDAIEDQRLDDPQIVYEIMDYMVSWPDHYHHPREDLIYAKAAEIDSSLDNDVKALQRDHDSSAILGIKVLAEIERWRDGESTPSKVVSSGRTYIEHVQGHMTFEEKTVFPKIESTLGEEDWQYLEQVDDLKPFPDPVFGRSAQRRFRNLSRKVNRKMNNLVEDGTMKEWITVEAMIEALEVLHSARASIRELSKEYVRLILLTNIDIYRESIATAPVRCSISNAKSTMRLIGDIASIYVDTVSDLERVDQERSSRSLMLTG